MIHINLLANRYCSFCSLYIQASDRHMLLRPIHEEHWQTSNKLIQLLLSDGTRQLNWPFCQSSSIDQEVHSGVSYYYLCVDLGLFWFWMRYGLPCTPNLDVSTVRLTEYVEVRSESGSGKVKLLADFAGNLTVTVCTTSAREFGCMF